MESGFFSGLNFVLAGALFNHSACTNNHPLYYGVQYVHRGRFYLSVNNGPVYNLEGPALFLTDPEMFFSYGSPPGTFREHYYICANGERMSRYIESGLFPLAAKQEQPYYKVLHPNELRIYGVSQQSAKLKPGQLVTETLSTINKYRFHPYPSFSSPEFLYQVYNPQELEQPAPSPQARTSTDGKVQHRNYIPSKYLAPVPQQQDTDAR